MNQLVLTKVAPWPTGRMFALLYLVIGIVIAPFLFLASLVAPEESEGGRVFGVLMSFAFPFLYGLIGLVGGMLMSVLYNVIAGLVGGIPLTFQAAPAESPAARPTPAPRPGAYEE
jgi:hypothetical protein